MRFLLQWLVAVLLTGICFVPAYLGMQFTDYPIYMSLTFVCAVVILVAMRFVHKAVPLHSASPDTEEEPK